MQNVKLAIWVGIRSLAHAQNLIVFLKYDTRVYESVCVCVCVYVSTYVCVCMFETKLLTKTILLWSQNSIIKATPTTCIGGLRNMRLLPTPLPLYSHLYHTMIVSCLQDLPFHSHVHNTSTACMQAVM